MADVEGLFPEVYADLRRLAEGVMRGERHNHTLQPTALVHEVYLKLADRGAASVNDRAHLLALAARAMRQVLIDHARARRSQKRGGGACLVTLSDGVPAAADPAVDWLEVEDALERLQALDPRLVRIVELRYLAGMEITEVAQVLSLSPTTVKRDTALARAWLLRELGGGN